MTAYLGTGEVNHFIVPQTPQADMAVAHNFERFDGLDEPPLDHNTGLVPFGANYGHRPRPGQNQTPVAEQVFTPGPISGLVNALGATPYPVGNRRPPNAPAFGAYTPAAARIVGGPKMGRQAYQGIAQTVFLSEITSAPPQPGDITSIISGWG